jgi:hypothetical protein
MVCATQVLVLYGNLVVLGLLILQKHSRRPKATDYSVFRYIQVGYPTSHPPEAQPETQGYRLLRLQIYPGRISHFSSSRSVVGDPHATDYSVFRYIQVGYPPFLSQ